jgi:transcriptional regulator with XRE-family HTH domain
MQKSNVPDGGLQTISIPTHNIGERIRAWRRSMSKTQAELADELAVDVGTLRKYELGMNAPGSLFLIKMYALGANINWVLGGEESMLRDTNQSDLVLAEASIQELREALRGLHSMDVAKFRLLVTGFVARTKEAVHLANLELQLKSKLPSQEGNEDIIRYSDTQKRSRSLLPYYGEQAAEDESPSSD